MEENKEYSCKIEAGYELELPQAVLDFLNIGSGDSVQFFEEDGKVFIDRA